MRTVQTPPAPISASAAMTTWAGTMNAPTLPTKMASLQLATRRPSTARLYIASRTATAARPYVVIPKMRPRANGAGARKRQAANPNRKAPRDADPVTRRTRVPVKAAAANKRAGRTTK